MLFNGNVFEKVDWNVYHQEVETWYMSMKVFFNIYDVLYTVEKHLENAFQR